jgi:hypothetical protein
MIHEPVLDSPLELKVSWDGSSLHRNDTGDWLVEAAPTSGGVYARLNAPVDELTGVRVGELNAELMRLLDAELGSSFGEVAAAPDVRVEVSH